MESFTPVDLNSREAVEGRKRGFNTYRFLAIMYFVVGGGLVATGILGVKNISEEADGPPYYIGGFAGGGLVFGQHIMNNFSFMGIFFGIVFAFTFTSNGKKTDEFDINDPIKYGMIGGLAAMFVLNVTSCCNIVITGSYFGVEDRRTANRVRALQQAIALHQHLAAQQPQLGGQQLRDHPMLGPGQIGMQLYLDLQQHLAAQQQQQQLGEQQLPGQPMLLPGQIGMQQSLTLQQQLAAQQQQLGGQHLPGQPMLLPGQIGMQQSLTLQQQLAAKQQQFGGQQLPSQPMLLPGQIGIQQPQPLIRPPPPSYNDVGSGF